MKKTMKKILCMVLVLMMAMPLIAFPANATPADDYAAAGDGALLRSVNFKADYWSQEDGGEGNDDGEAEVAEDGSSAKFTLKNEGNKRLVWGGIAEENCFTVGEGSKYTLMFDLQLGKTNGAVGLGIRFGDEQALVIDGNGHTYWYGWGSTKVGATTDNDERWNYVTDVAKADAHTFAVEIDYDNYSMTLYVKNSDGSFGHVRTVSSEDQRSQMAGTLHCSLFTLRRSGTVNDEYWAEISDLRIYKGLCAGSTTTVAGASVRMDVPTGIRFTGQFSKNLIDSLRDKYGEESVKLGMLITPTDYLTDNDVAFEIDALDACGAITGAKYVKIDAATILEDDGFYLVNCALAPVETWNYDRLFSARAYIEVNGDIYMYADFDLENNSRSIADVASSAYGDLKEEANDEYKYPVVVGDVTKYSCYTDEQRTLLEGFFQ